MLKCPNPNYLFTNKNKFQEKHVKLLNFSD